MTDTWIDEQGELHVESPLAATTCAAHEELHLASLRDAAVKVWTQAYQRLRELEGSGSHGCENGAAKAYEAGRITALSADLWEALGVPRPDDFNVRPVLPAGDSDEIIAKRRADLDQALNGGGAQKRMGGLST